MTTPLHLISPASAAGTPSRAKEHWQAGIAANGTINIFISISP